MVIRSLTKGTIEKIYILINSKVSILLETFGNVYLTAAD